MQYSSITILPTNRNIMKITHTTFSCMMAYNALDGSTHDNRTFNLYTKMMQYSSVTILPMNRKIKKITHTAFFCRMAYDALDGSTHDNKTFNLYTKKMIQYSSIMILPMNRKIQENNTGRLFFFFFSTMAYDALDGSTHKSQNQ